MAHFAELDENNIVTRVIVVHNNELMDGETESEVKGVGFCTSLYGHTNWIQTSYNNNMRKQFAGITMTGSRQVQSQMMRILILGMRKLKAGI